MSVPLAGAWSHWLTSPQPPGLPFWAADVLLCNYSASSKQPHRDSPLLSAREEGVG